MDSEASYWLYRATITLNGLNSDSKHHPLKVFKKSQRVSQDNGDYIRFEHSDPITDHGQTPVPFWDSQAVAPVPSIPLMGAGFIWKSVDNSGGFVAPVIVPFDSERDFKELDEGLFKKLVFNETENFIKTKTKN